MLFWYDAWFGEVPLKSKFSTLYEVVVEKKTLVNESHERLKGERWLGGCHLKDLWWWRELKHVSLSNIPTFVFIYWTLKMFGIRNHALLRSFLLNLFEMASLPHLILFPAVLWLWLGMDYLLIKWKPSAC